MFDDPILKQSQNLAWKGFNDYFLSNGSNIDWYGTGTIRDYWDCSKQAPWYENDPKPFGASQV